LLTDAAAAAAWVPQVLDIGFGHGESLVAAAADWSGARLLGVEVHGPGILRAGDRLAAAGADPTSVRILRSDVTALLPLLKPGSLRHLQAFHPDPWPKRRHEARRLFDETILARLVELLAPGGSLHLVTDDADYAASIGSAAAALPLHPAAAPGVPVTRYGRRAAAAGRTAHSMAWTR
jgi:tRNA (guanine-N7-)-methyltransferase